MGLSIEQERFDEADYAAFAERLEHSLEALRELLARPGFGEGAASLGAELELSLVDAAARPLPVNDRVLAETRDPRMTVELDRFNLECNLAPTPLAGRPFAFVDREMREALAEVERAAARHGGRVATIGILPTLRPDDLGREAMTDEPRYRALSAAIQRLRRGPFHLRIHGDDPLDMHCEDLTFEGANTSLQIHLRVDPAEFAALYNAIQLATAPALAVAGNSPTFLGHRLWEETRIAVFKQSVDARPEQTRSRRPARVAFGSGWLSDGAFELFAENVRVHEPLLPVLGDEDPRRCVREGGVPRLDEMRLHQGTVWRWNRAIYDPADGGHLRIEMRALPSGPSVPDMLANAAFLVGVALGLARGQGGGRPALPFGAAEENFYRAARIGLEAELAWPGPGDAPRGVAAPDLVRELLPVAAEGLGGAGVEESEVGALLSVIEERAASGSTGAAWQRRTLAELERRTDRDRALAGMLERYLEHGARQEPVHQWPLP